MTPGTRRGLGIFVLQLLTVLGGGCASDRDWTIIPPIEQNAYRQENEKITVAAECWTRHEDMRALFKNTPRE
jgi:hypothetical protein